MRKTPHKRNPFAVFFLRLLLMLLGLVVGFGVYLYVLLSQSTTVPFQPVASGEQKLTAEQMSQISKSRVKVRLVPEYPIHRVAQKDPMVENILIFGVDARSSEEEIARSDSMLILSLDRRSGAVKLSSLMRDIEIELPSVGTSKLNAAYAYGGVGLMIDTINQNFDLDIQKFMMLDFWSASDLVDVVGGISVPVQENELPELNRILGEMNDLGQRPHEKGFLQAAGEQHLDGMQAIAWARIRKVGSDHARTGRQRYVISEMLNAFKKQGPLGKVRTLVEGLKHVETNLRKGELLALGIRNRQVLQETQSYKVPEEGLYHTDESTWNMILDWDAQKKALHDFIYSHPTS